MILRVATWAMVAAMLFACSTPRLASIKSGEPVAIVVSTNPAASESPVYNLAINEDSVTGAKVGVAVGALAGFSCGPFWWICVPFYGAAGMYPGAIVGAGVGAVESLPNQKLTELGARLVRYRQAIDLVEMLRVSVAERASKHWPLVTDTSRNVINIELEKVFLNSTREERLTLGMKVKVSVRTGDARLDKSAESKSFEYAGPFGNYTSWVDEHNDFVNESFKGACQHIAAEIVSELASNRAR